MKLRYLIAALIVLAAAPVSALILGPSGSSSIVYAPNAPTLSSVSSASATSLSLIWSYGATDSSHSAGTSVNVYRGTAAGAESGTAVATGVTTSPWTDTGLTTGTTYYYKLLAANSAGNSAAYSNEASGAPTATVYAPGAPTIGTATAGNAQASVAFTPYTPDGSHSAATSYTATSSPGSLTATGGSSPLTVTGLTNGTPYTFTVTASNASGPSSASAASNSVTPSGSTYLVNDTFTGSDATAIASHTPDTGGAWSIYTPYSAATASLLSNRVQVDNSAGNGAAYYNAAAPGSADYTVSADCTLLTIPSGNYVCNVFARLDSAAMNYYQFEYISALGGWYLGKKVAGADTQLGLVAATLTAGQTYNISLTVSGTSLTAKVDGVTKIGPVTDSAFSAAGKAGFALSRGTAGTGNGFVVDNFKVQ